MTKNPQKYNITRIKRNCFQKKLRREFTELTVTKKEQLLNQQEVERDGD